MGETINTRNLTMKELFIYNLLRTRCSENCRENEVTEEAWPVILVACNIINLVYELHQRMKATDAAQALYSLLQKGFVAEFRRPGAFQSYVPFGYCKSREQLMKTMDYRNNCTYLFKFIALGDSQPTV